MGDVFLMEYGIQVGLKGHFEGRKFPFCSIWEEREGRK